VDRDRIERSATVKSKLGLVALLVFGLTAAVPARSQSASDQNSAAQGSTAKSKAVHSEKKSRSAGGEMASGTGDIGKGAAKGVGNLAVGAGKGAVDLVTLHPIDAAASVGKGGVLAGKNIGVGTVKGTGKIVKGVGKGIKHIF
jgi:hypothetical protein